MSTPDDPSAHAPMSPEQADALLELLINDSGFRQLFCQDLPAALERIGYRGNTDALICLSPAKLAPAQELQAAREALRDALSSSMAKAAMYVPFRLEAGKVIQTLGSTKQD